MKITTTTEILDLDGVPMKEKVGTGLRVLVLRDVLLLALITHLPGDENFGGQEKVKLFRMASLINSNAEVDLPAEDIALLKERVGRCCTVVVVGRVIPLLDPVPFEVA